MSGRGRGMPSRTYQRDPYPTGGTPDRSFSNYNSSYVDSPFEPVFELSQYEPETSSGGALRRQKSKSAPWTDREVHTILMSLWKDAKLELRFFTEHKDSTRTKAGVVQRATQISHQMLVKLVRLDPNLIGTPQSHEQPVSRDFTAQEFLKPSLYRKSEDGTDTWVFGYCKSNYKGIKLKYSIENNSVSFQLFSLQRLILDFEELNSTNMVTLSFPIPSQFKIKGRTAEDLQIKGVELVEIDLNEKQSAIDEYQ